MHKGTKLEVSFYVNINETLTNEEIKELEQNYKELIAYTFNKEIKKFSISRIN